jgi:hypothetical protein
VKSTKRQQLPLQQSPYKALSLPPLVVLAAVATAVCRAGRRRHRRLWLEVLLFERLLLGGSVGEVG